MSLRIQSILRQLLGVCLGLVLPFSAPAALKDSDCLECHSDKTLSKTNPSGKEILLFVDAAKLAASAHRTNTCASCHVDLTDQHPDDNLAAQPVDCRHCHERQSASYGASVHGRAVTDGDASAPACRDCHDSHEVVPPISPASPLHVTKQATTCGACHEEAAADYAASIHGKALVAGVRDAPTCTDCHSEHKIESLATGSARKISEDVCSRCHASERLNTKYNLPADRVRTFFDSYHGLANAYGSTLAANCASCHGYHKILPSTDTNSTIHANQLVATCGKCHPGANEKFSLSKIHVDLSAAQSSTTDLGSQINWWVRKIYLLLIIGTISGMFAHNFLLLVKKVKAHLRSSGRPIQRMNLAQRWQHAVLALSFIALAVTGFALKWPDSWLAKLMGSSEPFRRWSHRIAGVVLLLVGLYHLIYLVVSKDGRKLVIDFLPVKKDLADIIGTVRWLVGLRKEKPQIGRFGYAEKMEYWAVIWGTIIMGVTGLVVWFKMEVTHWLPRWAVDVALTIHYYEAILACLAIIVWHFYHVMFDPDVYPVNLACWDGKVSEHWQQEEHALEQPVQPTGNPVARPAAPEAASDYRQDL
jgi:formate dehydrogenase gamma subunit